MNFLADESVDQPVVERLRRQGHRVWYVAEMEPGISDEAVLRLARTRLVPGPGGSPKKRSCSWPMIVVRKR